MKSKINIAIIFIFLFSFLSCENKSSEPDEETPPTRQESLPDNAVKITPDTDAFPPVLHSDEWDEPVPMPGPINTAGVEDSPFISPDGRRFFIFFTPDANAPAENQIIDGVSGIWWSRKNAGLWSEPERIVLNDDLALDGAHFAQGDTLWFGSVRLGNYGEIDIYKAYFNGVGWANWENAGRVLNEDYDIGEFHLSADGQSLYFAADREGGYGGLDIWVTYKDGNGWGEPVNLGAAINSSNDENMPFLTQDGSELWFTGTSEIGYTGPAVFRSMNLDTGQWSEPEEIVSNISGEPTLDEEMNLYFVHIFLDEDFNKIEADIYVAYKK
ncbi:MAG: hypothetical protein GF307_12090 [candidate division Zixibacteria bacterium]|nr:hypothetical protein [candidate division Zixibacteria bacterium]